jgi:hypothetical protein
MDELQVLRDQNAVLLEAVSYALGIIENYEMDIRNSEWTGVDLEATGFCQGTIYKRALPALYRVLRAVKGTPEQSR